jgi:uncharacterized membrane protein
MERLDTSDRSRASSLRSSLRQVFVTGVAIVAPVLLTIVVLLVGLDALSGLLTPLVIPINEVLGTPGGPGLLADAIAVVVLGVVVLLVGALAESEFMGSRIHRGVDSTMASLPGVGSIYGTLNQLSEMLLESDTESFQEVVLVEYPSEGSYSVAFVTAEPSETIHEATDSEDLVSVFMPMGPNPVMGGFILHLRPDRVHDVDLTVEEGLSAVVSFGVSTGRAVPDDGSADTGGTGDDGDV